MIIRHIYIPICHYFNITQCESTYLQQCNLHSNMSLFQSLITSSCSLCRNYLHSNMSLFQWRRGCSYRITRGKFTFQYVTISIFQKSIPFFYRVKFTFQYVTISISTTMTINLNYCIIYIPICHYFNYGLGKSRRCGRNLHSNMSLFQFCYILYFLPVSYIYIPICHYFNEREAFEKKIKTIIYIPICHYFNLSENLLCAATILIYIPICHYFNPSPEFLYLFWPIPQLSVDQPKLTNILPYLPH